MAKDAYYFPHDSNAKDDPKCIMLIEELGMEGYGIFWVLIETLRDQPQYKAPMAMLPALGRRYNSSGEKFKAIVTRYGLFSIDNDEFFYSEPFSRRMSAIDMKRKELSDAGKRGNAIRWQSPSESGGDRVAIAIKEKEIKVNQIKGKTKSAGYPPDFDLAWELYKRKGSKKLALTEWNNLTDDEKKKVQDHIPAYIGNTEPKYIKDFERYLKHGKYESETVQTHTKSEYMTYDQVLVAMHKEGIAMNRFMCMNGESGKAKILGDNGDPMWKRK
jgi:hypothetical protein